ncbi:DUF6680 family protein [Paraburkholderia largidicola]|uniref:DUF6680 domain-containing protein n=1 Tax=Paraburkholderia largidicola TaxID=3014751 RepID=A0A7I8BJ55_9BURK|nr:DUF6680 family protein [Paraburkholderia sp. PGU16]BCF88727.1 hypothetical protein PPGU16_17940 [Paraburkholderia sp. PGU16]
MTDGEWVIAFATFAGPILAVQAQKWVERAREFRNRKSAVFHMLMATRGARLSPDHVRALNMIDLTFYGKPEGRAHKRTSGEQAVLDAWHEYHDHLSTPNVADLPDQNAFAERREDLFINLLSEMAADLGYKFDRVALKKSWYTPAAHGDTEARQAELMQSAIQVLSGRAPIKFEAFDRNQH